MSQSTQNPKPKFRLRLKMIFLFCLSLYILACIGCASFQRKLLYFPPHFTREQTDDIAKSVNLERWTNSSGEFIGMKRLSPKQPAEGQVLITYGNGSYAVGCARYVDVIQSAAALDVFILEYPGYADRPGAPSESSVFSAADEAFQMLPKNKPTYLVGESLGTGVSAYLAGTYPDKVAGLVLFAPFDRMATVAQYHMKVLPVRLFLTERFTSDDYLRNYHGPVGILIGGKDTVVPERFGRALFAGYNGPKHLWEFPDDNHWTVTQRSSEFWKEVVEFWRSNRH